MLVSSIRTVAPTSSLVTVEDVRAQARVDDAWEDDLISGIIAAAEQAIEYRTRRSLLSQTWRAYYSEVTCGRPEPLPFGPLSAPATVQYLSAASTWTSTTVSQLIDGSPAFWYPPHDVTPYDPQDGSPQWRATYTTGTDVEYVPTPIRQAVLMLAAHLYEQRTPIVIGTIVSDIPMTIEFLIAPFLSPTSAGI